MGGLAMAIQTRERARQEALATGFTLITQAARWSRAPASLCTLSAIRTFNQSHEPPSVAARLGDSRQNSQKKAGRQNFQGLPSSAARGAKLAGRGQASTVGG
jgi:hypothetical protein